MKITRMKRTTLNTPLGIAEITGDATGISRITILEQGSLSQEKVPDELAEAVDQMKLYFEGKLTQFTLTLNPAGTEFQKKVWKALCEIPFGETTSYSQLSKELGDIKAIRA